VKRGLEMNKNVKINSSKFSFRRVFVVTRRVLLQIRRDRRTFAMLIVMPIIIMAVFGFAFGGELKNLPIVVDNADRAYSTIVPPGVNVTFSFGENLTATLKADDRVHYNIGNFSKHKKDVDNGIYYAAIYIPTNFSECVFNKTLGQQVNAIIYMYIDATKPAIRASIIAALQHALQTMLGASGIIIEQEYAFNNVELSGLDTSMPSLIGYVLGFLVLLISSLTIKRETIGGTEERLFATPLRASERLIGYSLALILLSLITVFAMLLVSIFLFGVTIKGDIFLLFIMLILYALVHVFLAVFLSNFAKNEFQAVQMAVLIAIPSMVLSGVLIPVNSFPGILQIIAYGIPMYYGARIFEGIMLKGWGIIQLWPDILVISIMAIIFFMLAITTVRDKINA
jgi:ABC-2 type transport system permease protein